MLKLSVSQLKPGQVLAQDVARNDGVILMGKGAEITDEVIRLLDRLDIPSVVVEGDLFASDEEREAHLRREEEALDLRFSRVKDDKLLMGIRELFRARIRRGLAPPPSGGQGGG